jgi:hypothetical protein
MVHEMKVDRPIILEGTIGCVLYPGLQQLFVARPATARRWYTSSYRRGVGGGASRTPIINVPYLDREEGVIHGVLARSVRMAERARTMTKWTAPTSTNTTLTKWTVESTPRTPLKILAR